MVYYNEQWRNGDIIIIIDYMYLQGDSRCISSNSAELSPAPSRQMDGDYEEETKREEDNTYLHSVLTLAEVKVQRLTNNLVITISSLRT